jgi:hypothetical protein
MTEEEFPAWRQAYGIGGQWNQSPRARRGCIYGLGPAIVLIVVIFVVALLVYLLR